MIIMNKKEFVNELSTKLGFDVEKCEKINDILEDTFIIGNKNKEKIIEKFKTQFNMNDEDADKLYNDVMQVVGTGLKDKFTNPFGNK